MGEGTSEARGQQTRQEPASATQKWTLLETQDSPGHFYRFCLDAEKPFSRQSEGRALQLTAMHSISGALSSPSEKPAPQHALP